MFIHDSTFHNYLVLNFCPNELHHECSNDCSRDTTFLQREVDYQDLKPKETDNNGVKEHETREEIISNILQEEKFSLIAKKFKTSDSSKTYNFSNENAKKVYHSYKSKPESLTMNANTIKEELCIRKFLHVIRFDIAFKAKLKEFDSYCKERNSLESVLDDIIHSVRDGNVIDGIDCY